MAMAGPADNTPAPNFTASDLQGFGLDEVDQSAEVAADVAVETAMAAPDEEPAPIEADEPEEGTEESGDDEEQAEASAEEQAEPEADEPVGIAAAIRAKKQAKRYQRSGERYREEARQLLDEAKAYRQQIEQSQGRMQRYQAMEQAAQSGDFDRIIQQAAALSGLDYTTVMTRWVDQIANGGAPSPVKKELNPDELREQLKAELMAELRGERENIAGQQAAVQAIDNMMTVQTDDTLRQQFPYAAKLSADILRDELTRAYNYHAAQAKKAGRKQWPLANAVASVDQYAKKLHASFQGQGSPAAATPESPLGQGTPAQRAKPAQLSQSVTNQGAAAANAGMQRRKLSNAERARLADQRAAEGAAAIVDSDEWDPASDENESPFVTGF